MKKLAIIGASYLQEPLIEKAKSMGIETHVFAWAAGDVGEKSADYFYPISIVEKDEILKKCSCRIFAFPLRGFWLGASPRAPVGEACDR